MVVLCNSAPERQGFHRLRLGRARNWRLRVFLIARRLCFPCGAFVQGPVIFPSDVPLWLHLPQCGFVGVCSCDRGPAPSGDGRGLWHAFSPPTSQLVGLLLL